MPYTRIALLAGKPASWLQTLSQSLQQALETSFEVPPGDCFQVFQQCRPEELVFDRNYYACERSENFMLFHVTAGRERSLAVKENFYATLTRLLQANLGIAADDVMVVITTTSASDWSFGHGRSAMAGASSR